MKKKSIITMGFTAPIIILGLSVIASAHVQKGIKAKKGVVHAHRLGNTDFCHLRFPPIDKTTLGSGNPKLIDRMYGIMIDYYGDCNHDPLGKLEIERQKRQADIDRQLGQE